MAETRFPIWPFFLSLLFGSLYLIVGILEVLTQFGLLSFPFVTNDTIQSIMLLVVGIVFLSGTPSLLNRNREGYAFIIVGATLGAILFILQILVLASNALGWFFGFDEWLDWNALSDITASLWIFILLLVSYLVLRVTDKLDAKSTLFPKGGE